MIFSGEIPDIFSRYFYKTFRDYIEEAPFVKVSYFEACFCPILFILPSPFPHPYTISRHSMDQHPIVFH